MSFWQRINSNGTMKKVTCKMYVKDDKQESQHEQKLLFFALSGGSWWSIGDLILIIKIKEWKE